MDGLFHFATSLFKVAIIGIVAYFVISSKFRELVNLQTADLWQGVSLVSSLAARLLIFCALLLLSLSVPDLFFQRWQFRESLKMTREAAKEELKQEDGDPEMRRRLRGRYRELLSRNALNAVREADVVITNPTHYSVALEFDAARMDAPTVVAKGEDDLAIRMRETAKEYGVPVVPHPPLTRTLYSETEVGDQIPIRYWNVVAMVVGKFFSYEQKQAKARRSAGRMGA
jgi:flagellar biosynthetic protein FlhB